MSKVAPLGPRRFDLTDLSPENFEALCVRLARLEVEGVTGTGAPDSGVDALLPDPAGGHQRAWQAKNHRRIDWRKCRDSLDRAVETYGITHFTFCFSVDLTTSGFRKLEELRGLHPGVEVDHWGASEIVARLDETEEGRRVARFFFEDPEGSAELIARAIRAGGELRSVGQAVERVRAVGEYLDGDAFFIYPITQYPEGAGPAAAPGTMLSIEYPEDGRVVRIDAVPRDAEAAERYPARIRFALPSPDAERLDQARLRGEPVRFDKGVEATWQSLPPAFAHDVGRTFDAGVFIDFTPDPWIAEFRASACAREESLRLEMKSAHAPPEWDRAYEGHVGGLAISLLARLEDRQAVSLKWTHRSDGSPAREQMKALRFLAAMHEGGEFVMCECEEGRRLLSGPNDATAMDVRLPRLLSLMTDVVSIEDWIGADLKVPAEISGIDLETAAAAARAIRDGREPFAGEHFRLVGDPRALPKFEGADDMDIGEDWIVEMFGEEVMLGRRTLHFRPSAVHLREVVEPGRQVIEIEPSPLSEDEELWWIMARPG
jgi:hypothetical protein